MKRVSKSFEIALSAIACAVAAVALTVGCYVDFLLAAGYMIAVFCMMIPLSKGFWAGAILAEIGAVLLAFMFYGFSIMWLLPFLIFFGLHPTVNFLQKKYVKKNWLHAIVFLVKAVWFDLVMWLAFWIFAEVFAFSEASWYDFVMKYFFVVLFVGGTVFFAAYDFAIFLCQQGADRLIVRIRR